MTFTSQSKALLLLTSDSDVQLLTWQHGALHWIRAFGNTPLELENFAAALLNYKGLPVLLLADLVEESFRHDTIVHVSGSDRAALIKRKLEFAFRNTSYRLGKITGRLEQGRRDDRILLSAITKPDLLDIRINILLQQKFAIQSVTSVAHLLHALAAIDRLEQESHLLIINLDNSNNLRQTFIKKGQVLFSRRTSLSTRDARQLGSDIYRETLQIRQYFERIQFIPYEAPLRIQVYAPHDEQLLQLETRTTDNNRFEVRDVRPLLAAMAVDLQGQQANPVYYFLARVLAKQRLENIYAPPAARKYHDLNTLSRAISVTASLVLVLALAVNVPVALDIRDKWQQRDTLQTQVRPLQAEYQALLERLPDTPIPSREMELVVKTHDLIEQQIHSPLDSLNLISGALARAPGLKLTGITWRLDEKVANPPVPGNDSSPVGRPEQELGTASEFVELVLQNNTAISVQIDGQAYSPDSFRDAQEQVTTFVAALSANSGVEVFVSRMPTEVRTDIRVSTTVDDGEVRAPFTLQLTLGATIP